MLHRLVIASVVVGLIGCGSPTQQKPPRIPDDTESAMTESAGDSGDMDSGEEGSIEPAAATAEETPEQKRQKCCQECVDGLAKDESGDPPGAINCSTLVGPGCVLFLEKSPMTGGEAQKCIEAAGSEAPAPEGG
jgi:hypothetical protein